MNKEIVVNDENLLDVKKFNSKKLDSIKVSEIVSCFDMSRGIRILECGTFLEFGIGENTGEIRLLSANFCRERLCPMCQWRKSLRNYSDMKKTLSILEKDYGKFEFVFLTLTERNCNGDELSDRVDNMLKAYSKLVKSKTYKKSIKGSYRNLEITYNKDSNTFHPHLHCILAVNQSYWKKSYISKSKWIQLWRDCLNVNYVPVVDVRKIDLSFCNAVSEVTKYTFKSADLFTDDIDTDIFVMQSIFNATYRKRLANYYGVLREARSKVIGSEFDDMERSNLTDTDEIDLEENYVRYRYLYNSGVNMYELYKK